MRVISSDPQCKDGNARSDQKCGRYRRFSDSKSVYFCEFLHYFYCKQKYADETANENKHFKIIKTLISQSALSLNFKTPFPRIKCKFFFYICYFIRFLLNNVIYKSLTLTDFKREIKICLKTFRWISLCIFTLKSCAIYQKADK